jgi:hypothetical protein
MYNRLDGEDACHWLEYLFRKKDGYMFVLFSIMASDDSSGHDSSTQHKTKCAPPPRSSSCRLDVIGYADINTEVLAKFKCRLPHWYELL